MAKAGEIAPGEGRQVAIGGLRLAVFNHEGDFYALDDDCPHQGASLATGTFHAGRIICPLHSWVFDIRTGRCPRDTHDPVAVYPTRCTGDRVEVGLPEEIS